MLQWAIANTLELYINIESINKIIEKYKEEICIYILNLHVPK